MSCHPTVIKLYPACVTACPETPEYTFENANLAGEGVFYQKVGNVVSFYGVGNTDGTITVTLDATNNFISLDLDAELLAGNFPDATTTAKGKVELAIDAEALAKTSTTHVLTPSNLAALGATTSFAGFVELATTAEANALTDTTRALTPGSMSTLMSTVVHGNDDQSFGGSTSIETTGGTWQWITSTGTYTLSDTGLRFEGVPVVLATGGHLNFNGGKIQLAGVDVPANSVIGTTAVAGTPTSFLKTVFIQRDQTSVATGGTTIVDITGGAWEFDNGPGFVEFSDGGMIFDSTPLVIAAGADLNFATGSRIQVLGVDVPADSFIRTGASGETTSELCALYFGPTSTTETWFVPAFVPDRDIDPATCTLPELATAFNTLLTDLAAVKKPVIV